MKFAGSFLLLMILLYLHSSAFAQIKKNSDSSVHNEGLKNESTVFSIPDPIGWVNDFANMLTVDEIYRLDSIISQYEKKTTVQIAVVTLNTKFDNGEQFEDYGLMLANKWGVGQKEKNNGIVIAISRELRRVRIYNGYGIENIITDSETMEIIDQIFIPHFRNGDYFKGIQLTILELIRKLEEKD